MSKQEQVTAAHTAAQDRELKSALLDLGKPDYERVRADLIARLGYDAFRDLQNEVFKQLDNE